MRFTVRNAMFLASIVGCVLVHAGHSAWCQDRNMWSGGHWLSKCSPTADAVCVGFLFGMNEFNDLLVERQRVYCRPNAVSLEQLRKVIIKELQGSPSTLHEPFIVLALQALQKAFPCSKISN